MVDDDWGGRRRHAVRSLMLTLVQRSEIRIIGLGSVGGARGVGELASNLASALADSGASTALINLRADSGTSHVDALEQVWSPGSGVPVVSPASNAGGFVTKLRGMASGSTQRDPFGNPGTLRAHIERDFANYSYVMCTTAPLTEEDPEINPYSVCAACDGVLLDCDPVGDTLDGVRLVVEGLKSAGAKVMGTVLDETDFEPTRSMLARRVSFRRRKA